MPSSREVTYQPARQSRRGRGPVSSAPVAMGSRGGRGAWTTPKRLIWTGAFAAVTIVGSIYGAGLKTQQEYHAEKKQILETPIEERISALEAHRARLVTQKRPLERKRDELRLRIQKQQNEASQSTDTRS
ncbi:hypothetical protein F5Y03DRAFT_229538 [Xylaria venustula]|nr:hypothetical protein F5Y03DRAFT_229538 [Xylaria venustula]